ncbi:carbohydrate porin [Asticcacaulis sp. 201]|uniref:carbohydrate porin n=1 Tax=Asticcacaulis sp. 201 TaxID=3028787 RepID=UPI0029171273|nr:carbohydrate porin [Asticcacaulis sp. 201]MDV6331217.1 carbohydrate porin [Asticcacaulis sp. 201]
MQTVSNIDAPHGVRLFEAWVCKTANSGRWSMTGGLINLNGMFDVQEAGVLFLNSSHGIGPDYSRSGPSIFAFSALGVVGEWRAHETLRLRVGGFDGGAGDPLHHSSFIAVKLNDGDVTHVVAEVEQDFKRGYLKLGGTYTAKSERLYGNGMAGNNSAGEIRFLSP